MAVCFECGGDVVEKLAMSFSFQDDESSLDYSVQATSGSICRQCFAEALLGSLSVTVLWKADELFNGGAPLPA